MADDSGDRTKFFPAIEKKHGGPISIWLDRVTELGDAKYPEQIAYLRENHGFSQAHANAVVMYVRGSTTSKRFSGPDEYFQSLDPVARTTAQAVFATITATHPQLELVVAWNQPMLRTNGAYVIGLSAATNHLMLNPFSKDVLAALADRLSDYEVSKHTFRIPLDWKVDEELLCALVDARLAELD
jgi:uncharacterized protein YdhG (YjbR/CyaY superfamily)